MKGGDGEKSLAGEKRAPLEGSDWKGVIRFFILSCHTGRISLGSRAREKAAPRDGNGTQNIFLINNTICVIVILVNSLLKNI